MTSKKVIRLSTHSALPRRLQVSSTYRSNYCALSSGSLPAIAIVVRMDTKHNCLGFFSRLMLTQTHVCSFPIWSRSLLTNTCGTFIRLHMRRRAPILDISTIIVSSHDRSILLCLILVYKLNDFFRNQIPEPANQLTCTTIIDEGGGLRGCYNTLPSPSSSTSPSSPTAVATASPSTTSPPPAM